MPATIASRAALRQSKFLLRRNNFRHASTAAESATKAKESVSTGVSKASEGLSRVQSSATSALSSAGSTARSALNKVGGRTGRLIAFVDSIIPPTIYYSRVGLELSKIVFRGQKMTPPSLSQFQSYFQPVIDTVRSPSKLMATASSIGNSANPESMLSRVRNVNTQQLVTLGVIGAEILGFFTVGTMIGRMKIVGYHGEPHHAH